MQKLTKEEAQKRFESLYNGEYKLVSEFNGPNSPSKIQHSCGNVYTIQRLTRFFNGTGGQCPVCSKKEIKRSCSKLTEETLKTRLNDEFNGIITYISGLSEKGRDSLCTFKCEKCLNTFTKTPHSLFSSRNTLVCPNCSISKKGYYENIETYLEDTLNTAKDGKEYEWVDKIFKGSRVKHKIKHITCGNIYEVRPYYFRHGDQIRCPKCASKKSKIEREIFEFIKELEETAIQSDRTQINPYELDIYVPEKKIAFEINGLYWHSEKRKGKNYHKTKLEKCTAAGIRLIQIFEDEWNLKQKIVKSKIRNILGHSNARKIFARKCICKKISVNEYRPFFEKNHIQGFTSISIVYGLYFENKLVAAGGFNKLRNSMNSLGYKNAWDMIRYATDISYSVIGGCSKIIKEFIKREECSYIKTLADLRWSDPNNNLYTKIGFTKLNTVEPRYFYTDGKKRIPRFNFRKSEIKNKFPAIYDEKLTEFEMMDKTNLFRIWDAGKITYEMKVNNE